MSTTRDEIVAFSDAWARAIVANDADAIARFCADDWILVSEHGVLPKEVFISLVRSGELAHEAMETAEIAAFHEHGDTAVLAARVTSVAIFGRQRFGSDEWTSDVFLRGPEGWKCVVTHVTSVLAKRGWICTYRNITSR